jgi:hypothetical protein
MQAVLELCQHIGSSTTSLQFDIKQMEVRQQTIEQLEASLSKLKLDKERIQAQAK